MKKVLVISMVPTPPVLTGYAKCVLEYCELLKKINIDVHFLYIQGKTKLDAKGRDELFNYWGEKLHVYDRKLFIESFPRFLSFVKSHITGYENVDSRYPVGLTQYVESLQKKLKFDGIIINYVVLSKLFSKNLGCKRIIYTHDVFAFKNKRLHMSKVWFNLRPNEEARGIQRADIVLSIQENESEYFRYISPLNKIYTVFSYFPVKQQPLTYNQNILFLSGDSEVNRNGILFFIKDVLPYIVKKYPNALLYIGGSICKSLSYISNPNIVIIGRVDKEEDFYSLGDIAINPIYQGTGLKIKTFEALSYGKITVAHPHSTEGIYDKSTAPILIGNNAEEMAEHINSIFSNNCLRERYSKDSLQYIENLNNYVEETFKKAIFE